MTMVIPTIPTMPAGYVATAADLNNLSAGATFLLNKPIARVHDGAGTFAIPTSLTAVPFNTKDFDPDGMWSSGANTILTVQTPGFYKISYAVDATTVSGAAIPMNTLVQVVTGANNPAGTGVNQPFCWGGYSSGGVASLGKGVCHASGIIPFYMYIGDNVQIQVKASSTGMTTNTGPASFMAMELVSI